MRTPRSGKLWKEYSHVLHDVWKQWDAHREPGSWGFGPFAHLKDVPKLDQNAGYNHMVGWVLGVSDYTGWSLIGGTTAAEPRHKLRDEFEARLKEVWIEYDSRSSDGRGSTPFANLEDVPELDDNPGFNYEVGWLIGVSQASGWSLESTGPREWSPRGWKGL